MVGTTDLKVNKSGDLLDWLGVCPDADTCLNKDCYASESEDNIQQRYFCKLQEEFMHLTDIHEINNALWKFINDPLFVSYIQVKFTHELKKFPSLYPADVSSMCLDIQLILHKRWTLMLYKKIYKKRIALKGYLATCIRFYLLQKVNRQNEHDAFVYGLVRQAEEANLLHDDFDEEYDT